MMDTVRFDLPDFWASALINGDESGLEDEDIKALDAFTDYMVKTYGQCWCIDCSDDEGDFRWRHDASFCGVLACNVLEYTFDVTKRD